MGGYGASAYADALKITRILLINPISTRKRDIAILDFESRRSLETFEYDWESDYYDGAMTNAEGYIVYDPLFHLDKLHAIRYKNLKHLKVPGLGHGMPGHLNKINVLDWLVDSFIKNDIDDNVFYEKVRKRRNLKRYYQWMTSNQNKYLTTSRKKVIDIHRKKILMSLSKKERGSEKYKGFDSLSNGEIKSILDVAVMLEGVDINVSHSLMELALKLRPRGKFIISKIKEYRNIIASLEND